MRRQLLHRVCGGAPGVALLAVIALASAAPAGAIVGGTPAPPGRWPWMVASSTPPTPTPGRRSSAAVSSSACAACSPRATASSTTWLLCAGTAAGDTGPCTGDSGGPLVVGSPDAWLDVGVLTGGDSCAARGYFDLYARVDRISAFALRPAPTVQPDPIAPPRVVGHMAPGAKVRCLRGRWGGSPAHFSARWKRLGRATAAIVGRGATHRLSPRDARSGVGCSVTAANRGGRVTAASTP